MPDIGTGIIVGCGIFGGLAALFRVLGNRRLNGTNSDPISWRVFKEHKREEEKKFDAIIKTVDDGFSDIRGKIQRIHERLDDIIVAK